jgi:hypothetical protein
MREASTASARRVLSPHVDNEDERIRCPLGASRECFLATPAHAKFIE